MIGLDQICCTLDKSYKYWMCRIVSIDSGQNVSICLKLVSIDKIQNKTTDIAYFTGILIFQYETCQG